MNKAIDPALMQAAEVTGFQPGAGLDAYWMPFTANRQFKKAPRLLARASGMHYWDDHGRQILDGVAGLWCVNAGHARPRIVQAIQQQAAELDFAPPFQMAHPKAFELADKVAKLAPAGIKPTVSIELSFARAGGQLEVSISWTGEANANDVAVMFGGDEVEDFARGGCWATCHSDMPGMTRDRNQGIEKYLRASRAQLRSIGRPPIIHDAGTLAEMTAAGAYVELWRANLAQATVADVEVYRVLDRRDRVAEPVVTARGGYVDGRWTVTFSRPLADARKSIEAGRTYTLGVALHGDGKSGADHWVSLPVTLSLDGIDTDFVAKQQSE